MKLRQDLYDASERRGLDAGIGAKLAQAVRDGGKPPLPTRAIIRRTTFLSANGNTPSPTELERILGENDLVDEFYLQRGLIAASPVCRVVLRSGGGRELGYATGFLVSPRILLTNWHVLPTVADAANAIAEFNYLLDYRGNPAASTRFELRPDLFHFANQALDFALVCVDATPVSGSAPLTSFGYHQLIAADGKISEKEWITIIQHPSGRPRQFAIRDNQLLAKRDDGYLWYASDTAPGSSGAPAFNDSFQVVALHHMGKAERRNGLFLLRDGRTVPSIDGLDDTEVVWEANEGIRTSFICKAIDAGLEHGNPYYLELRHAMEQGGVMAAPPHAASSSGSIVAAQAGQGNARLVDIGPHADGGPGIGFAATAGEIVLPITLRIFLTGPATATPAAAHVAIGLPANPDGVAGTGQSSGFETLVAPFIETDYTNRQGYDASFLGIDVPLPVVDPTLVAHGEGMETYIKYQNFSIAMHKERRLALVTASNIDANPGAKQPEPGKDYSRRGLTGLAKNDQELWVTDPRIPEQFQIPDVFYTKDGANFDKGHIVRREDVCWGKTYAQVRRANGDTYHTTNCSPQLLVFNRATAGVTNWGDLENDVLAAAKIERLTLFAGPMFDARDPTFKGRDKRGALEIKIPRRFWKVVVAKLRGAPASFAFVLEQDLSHLPPGVEFDVDAKWRRSMIKLAELQKLLNGVKFTVGLKGADQFGKVTGERVRGAVEISGVNT